MSSFQTRLDDMGLTFERLAERLADLRLTLRWNYQEWNQFLGDKVLDSAFGRLTEVSLDLAALETDLVRIDHCLTRCREVAEMRAKQASEEELVNG